MIKYGVLCLAFVCVSCRSMVTEFSLDHKPASLKMLAARSVVKNNVPYQECLAAEMTEYVDLLKNNFNSMDSLLQQSIMRDTEHFEDLLLLLNAKDREFDKKQLSKRLLKTAVLFSNAFATHYLLAHGADPDTKFDKKEIPAVVYAACNPEINTITGHLLEGYTDHLIFKQRHGKALVLATRIGNIALLEKLLQSSFDVSSRTHKGSTWGACALNSAIRSHNQKAVEHLLQAGVDPNEGKIDKFQHYKFPLYEALDCKNFKAVKQLVKYGADVKIGRHFYGGSCLKRLKDTQTADFLLEHGADIEAEDINGCTPLNSAAFSCKSKVIEYLLNKNASVNRQNKNGETALYQAGWKGNMAVIQMLLNAGANPHIKTSQGMVFLTHAAHFGHSELVELILKQSIEETFKDQQELPLLDSLSWVGTKSYECCISLLKNTLLHKNSIPLRKKLDLFDSTNERLITLFSDDIVNVQECIKKGMDINAPIDTGSKLTPLMIALYANAENAIKYLLSQGVSIHKHNDNEISLLSCAIQANSPKSVKLLLAHGADVNEKNASGRTIFLQAVEHGSIEICKILLQCKDLDINARYYDSSPLQIAIKLGNQELVKMILAHEQLSKPISARAFLEAIRRGDLDLVKKMVTHADIECCETFGKNNTPLISAVYNDESEIIKFLLDQKASQTAKNMFGMTAFLAAVDCNNEKAIELLLHDDPTQINVQANGGYTALMFATFHHYKNLIKLLLEHNADPFIKDKNGRTPLMHAYLRGNHEIIQMLKDGMKNYRRENKNLK